VSAYSTAGWENFLVAETGAAAALAGLLFVAVSLNISRILGYPGLPGRAAEAMLMLFNVLASSSLGLIPGQSSRSLGLELVAVNLLICVVTMVQQIRDARRPEQRAWWSATRISTSQLGLLAMLATGVSLLAQRGGGLYWLPAGIILSFGAALYDAWILLVEILR
jgi:hypothetical protein